MKRFLSILLVAVMLLGMLPATALTANAASYEKATSIAVGDTVLLVNEANKKELSGFSTSSTIYGTAATYTTVPAGVTPLEVVAGSTSGTYAFKMAGNKYLYWTSGNSLATNGTLSANTSWTVSFDASGNATIANSKDSARKIFWNNSSPRFACYNTTTQQKVQLYKLVAGGCEHANTENRNVVAPECTTVGTHDVYCLDCKTYIEEDVETAATGHNYENGVCTKCGNPEPDGYALVTDVSTLKANDKVVITVTTKAGKTYAMGNNNGTDKAPAAVTVTVEDGVIAEVADNLIWNVSYSNGNLTIYPDGVTNKWLYCTDTNNGVRVGTNANKTFTVDAATKYLKHTATSRFLGAYETTPDWRCYTSHTTANIANQTLAFYKLSGSACDHFLTVTIPEVPATCTSAGTYEIQKCACGQNVVGGGEIPALDHSYTDDACIRCGVINPNAANKAELMTALPENGDVIIIYHVKEKVLMSTATIHTNYGNRMGLAAAEANGTQMPYSASAVSLLTVEIVDDQYRFLSADGKYMTSGATGNSLSFTDEATEYSLWEIETLDEDNKLYIHNVSAIYNDAKQTLEVYNDAFYPYSFNSSYSSSYELQLYLVEKGAEPVVEANGKEFSSVEDALKESNELKLLAPVDSITYAGDLYLDLNGFSVESVVLSGELHAYDSKATTSAASGAKIAATNVANVVKDLTVDGKRYIALEEGEDGYSFHVLEMKLSKVTLRAAAAGIYYKATISCDAELAAATQKHGVLVSTYNMPGADFATEKEANGDINAWTVIQGAPESGKEITSGSVFGIFKADKPNVTRGETKIYANAYLDLGEGRIILADQTTNDKHDDDGFDGTAMSLRDVVEMVNDDFAALTDEAKRQSVIDMYTAWSAVMNGWDIPNIIAAANQNG